MKNDEPMFGEFVKLVKTGEILKMESYDAKKQMLEIELPTGAISTVHRHEIERITPNEEVEFLRSRGKS